LKDKFFVATPNINEMEEKMSQIRILKVCVCALVALALVFSGDIASAQKKVNLVIASGPIESLLSHLGGIASLCQQKAEGLNMNVQVTGGGWKILAWSAGGRDPPWSAPIRRTMESINRRCLRKTI
jgi:hypothetical protein